jgi:hypothetical protein
VIYKNMAKLQVKRVRNSNRKTVAWAKQFADRML